MDDSGMRWRFGAWTFDPRTGDLVQADGSVERLRPQAGQVLERLLADAGSLVSRETLQEEVWPDTVVEFDQGLNACVREIRRALGDSASDPTWVETFPRRGYRFLASAERVPSDAGPTGSDHRASDGSTEWAEGRVVRRETDLASDAMRPAAFLLLTLVVVAVGLGIGAVTRSGTDARDPTAGAADSSVSTVSAAVAGRDRLLVLPLRSPDPDPRLDTVADVLTERLIGDLSRLAPARLGVIARTSALRYADSVPPLDVLAADLSLRWIVEGAVVGGAEPVVQLRLVDPADATQRWAGQWPVVSGATSTVGDRAGRGLAAALDPALAAAWDGLVFRRTGDAAARDAAARAGWLLARHTMEATETALELVDEALVGAPGDASLLELRAVALRRLGAPEDAERVAREALAADPASSEAHRVLGLLAQGRMAWDTARAHLERAVELAPGSSEARTSLAVLLNYLGYGGEAVVHIDAALSLDPVSATLSSDAGVVYLWAGRFDGAERHCAAAIRLDPLARAARRCLIRLAHLTDRPELGAEPARELLERDGPGVPTGVAPPDGYAGRELLAAYWTWIAESASGDGCGPLSLAEARIVQGRIEEAAGILRALPDDASSCFLRVRTDPLFAPVRNRPGVAKRIEALGLPGSG